MSINIIKSALNNKKNLDCLFKSRTDAAVKMAEYASAYELFYETLIYIPFGGIPLRDVFILHRNGIDCLAFPVVKIPSKFESRFGIGAINILGKPLINNYIIKMLEEGTINENIDIALKKQQVIMKKLCFAFPQKNQLEQKHIMIVDDGLSSGYTLLATLDSIYNIAMPKVINCLIPVAHIEGIRKIRQRFTDVNIFSLYIDNSSVFLIDEYYKDFSEITIINK